MKALTYQGLKSIAYTDMPDPSILEPTDALIQTWQNGR